MCCSWFQVQMLTEHENQCGEITRLASIRFQGLHGFLLSSRAYERSQEAAEGIARDSHSSGIKCIFSIKLTIAMLATIKVYRLLDEMNLLQNTHLSRVELRRIVPPGKLGGLNTMSVYGTNAGAAEPKKRVSWFDQRYLSLPIIIGCNPSPLLSSVKQTTTNVR